MYLQKNKCLILDKNEIIDLNQLESIYKKLIVQGKKVMCLIANACATSTGLFDPLDQMGVFCEKYNIWFHVDGAHGASALVSNKNKKLVKGLRGSTGGYLLEKPSKPRIVGKNIRTIKNRIISGYRDKNFFDGDRNFGYGGFNYDGRWQKVGRLAQSWKDLKVS